MHEHASGPRDHSSPGHTGHVGLCWADPKPAATEGSGPPPGTKWDVTQIRCEQLLGADDDDRAAASMFYYGYLAARSGLTVIDTGKMLVRFTSPQPW